MLKLINHMNELNFHAIIDLYSNNNEIFHDQLSGCDKSRFDAEQDFYQYLRDAFFSVKDAFYAVWCVENQYVSAVRAEPYRDGMLLEALETAPQYRRKGYATKLLSAVIPAVRETGYAKLYAHVSKQNLASLSVHEKCGFSKLSNSAVLIDGSVMNSYLTLLYDLKKPG